MGFPPSCSPRPAFILGLPPLLLTQACIYLLTQACIYLHTYMHVCAHVCLARICLCVLCAWQSGTCMCACCGLCEWVPG